MYLMLLKLQRLQYAWFSLHAVPKSTASMACNARNASSAQGTFHRDGYIQIKIHLYQSILQMNLRLEIKK